MMTSLPRSICWTSPERRTRELVTDLGALAFAHALDDALLGCLHRGAAELGEVHRNLELVADLKLGVLEPGFLEGDLAGRIGNFFHDGLEQHDPDGALVLVDRDFRLYRRPVLLGEGGVDTVFQQPVQFGAVDLLRVRQLADRRQDLYRSSHVLLLYLFQ
jgi:hypothetical protein